MTFIKRPQGINAVSKVVNSTFGTFTDGVTSRCNKRFDSREIVLTSNCRYSEVQSAGNAYQLCYRYIKNVFTSAIITRRRCCTLLISPDGTNASALADSLTPWPFLGATLACVCCADSALVSAEGEVGLLSAATCSIQRLTSDIRHRHQTTDSRLQFQTSDRG